MIIKIVFIFSLFIVINGANNCSGNNKCGSQGYCYVNDDEILCECKFWWEGDLCNHQSASGRQVIALGCMAGSLIFLFVGLNIGRKLYNKCKTPKEKHKKISTDPKLIDVAIEHAKKTFPLSSCIITVLMIVVSVGTLLAKWALIKQIHDEIVAKYRAQQPLYFTERSFCDTFGNREFNVVMLPLAGVLIIICMVVTRRASLLRNKCYGYGAPPIPVDFFSQTDRKFAAVIFAVIADELLQIVKEFGGTSDKKEGILLKFSLRVAKVLVMGFRFYPLLACAYINSIITLTCAIIYAWLDYSFVITIQGMCTPTYYPSYDDYLNNQTSIEENLKYFGDGPGLVAVELCTDIPSYVCLAYISVKLLMMLIEKIRERRERNPSIEKKMSHLLTREQKLLLRVSSDPDSVNMLYVRNLFRSASQRPKSQALFARVIPRFIYEWRDDFQFSTRVLCIYSSIFLLLFLVIVNALVQVIPLVFYIQGTLQEAINDILGNVDVLISAFAETGSERVPLSIPLPNIVTTYICAVTMTITIVVVQLVILLANIRRNLLQAYRGDDTEIPRRQRSDYVNYATGNFHFAGYFIGYLVWGFITIAIFSSLVCLFIAAYVEYGTSRVTEKAMKAVVPSILLVLFKIFLNKLLAQYVFLQDYGEVLALNNRRFFMIFIYFNFFLDAFLGFISSILRLVKSILGGIFYMCRLDYSPLGRKLETLDSGFTAYCGFIHTECTHRHPVMLVFVSYLYNEVKKNQYLMSQPDFNEVPRDEKMLMQQKKSLRYIRKWKLAMFLVRNPTIVFFRKAFLKNLSPDQLRAINDLDNDSHVNTQRGALFYIRQMAVQQPNFTEDIDPTQIIIQRF